MRVRRHVPGGASREHRAPTAVETQPQPSGRGRPWLRDALVVLATFGVGYVIASAWLSPAPLVSSDHAVPRLLELPAAEVEGKLSELGFRARVAAPRQHPAIPAGHVAWQDPPAGMVLPENTAVTYAISSGPAPIPVPDVIGFTRTHAERVLAAAGLRRGTVDTVAADPEAGVVIATRPAAGTGRARGDRVDLVVSGRALPGAVPVPALHIAPPGRGPR